MWLKVKDVFPLVTNGFCFGFVDVQFCRLRLQLPLPTYVLIKALPDLNYPLHSSLCCTVCIRVLQYMDLFHVRGTLVK